MKNKVLQLLLFSTLTVCLTLTFAKPNPSHSNQETKQDDQETATRPALTQDFVSASGEKILEFIEASYQSTNSSWDGASCRIKNLSGKTIIAMGLVWTVTFSNGETLQIEQLIDSRVHKDVADVKRSRPFAPNDEKVIRRSVRESLGEGQSIETIKVKIDFAEFDNSEYVSVNDSEMYKQLLLQRQGAEIYKKWLEDTYGNDFRKIDKVIEKLLGDELPGDKKLEDGRVKQGASVYKQWLLGMYSEKGADGLKQILRGR